ncbi:MAG: CvpA family protein [Planctomycetales bacterium]|nr:CvpA family protein [Planctomycetales bacterium]
MQAYDLLLLIVIGMATIFGAIKGFAWQVASLASIVVSYVVAYRWRFDVAEMIQAKPPWNQFLAMLILFVGTSFVIWVGFRLFSSLIDRVRLKEFDRHLGAAFGFAKGLVYCLLITMFAMSLLGPNQQAAICQSRSGYYISVALDRGVGILPKEIHDVVGPYLASLDSKLNSHDGHTHAAGGVENGGLTDWPDLGDMNLDSLPGLESLPRSVADAIPPFPPAGNFKLPDTSFGVGTQNSPAINSPVFPATSNSPYAQPQSFPPLPSANQPTNGPQNWGPQTAQQPTTYPVLPR